MFRDRDGQAPHDGNRRPWEQRRERGEVERDCLPQLVQPGLARDEDFARLRLRRGDPAAQPRCYTHGVAESQQHQGQKVRVFPVRGWKGVPDWGEDASQ